MQLPRWESDMNRNDFHRTRTIASEFHSLSKIERVFRRPDLHIAYLLVEWRFFNYFFFGNPIQIFINKRVYWIYETLKYLKHAWSFVEMYHWSDEKRIFINHKTFQSTKIVDSLFLIQHVRIWNYIGIWIECI